MTLTDVACVSQIVAVLERHEAEDFAYWFSNRNSVRPSAIIDWTKWQRGEQLALKMSVHCGKALES